VNLRQFTYWPLSGRDARSTAGETPALRYSALHVRRDAFFSLTARLQSSRQKFLVGTGTPVELQA
jgi:hypothetical protein